MSIWNRVALIEMTEAHLPIVLSWRNQDFVRNMMYNNNVISMKEHVEWFNKLQKNKSSIAKVFLLDDKPYGVVNISKIDQLNGTCEWSLYIGENSKQSGLGTLLGYLAINFIFDSLSLDKLYAEVLGFNEKSYYLHKKLGLEQGEVLKKHFIKEDVFFDVILFSLLKSNWIKQSDLIKTKIENKFNY